ncbi:MAG: hypothetical protein A2144_04360 [Chloroflexi bacterium RBG_16_50_9]|nr:MAG: hypothetical protein A2144_04360 [Chloroflexi bacterium RBG_16_50_9]
MQSPANPQSLNRFSYALNNPLKYTDPSGHIVTIEGVNVNDLDNKVNSGDYMWFMRNGGVFSRPLVRAYGTLRQVAPRLTGYVERSSQVISISMSSATNHLADFIPGISEGGSILVNPALIANFENNTVAGALGHELFHSAITIGTGNKDNFAGPEAFAFSIQYAIEEKLDAFHLWGDQFSDINPWKPLEILNPRLETAADQLADISDTYTQGHWFWQRPWDIWPGDDPNGEKFLDVAKTVWVN